MTEAIMIRQRRIARVVTVPPLEPGFVGPGHLAAQVVSPEDFAIQDPFIMLADDHLDIGDRPVGGPHPHAGFETVTLLLEGAIYDRDEGGVIRAGEVQWMTAGSGIIHGEHVHTQGKVRLLQLWLTLPRDERWTTPAFQDVHADAVPVRREPGVEARVYSGSSGTLRSATRNHVPVTIVEFVMNAGASIEQDLPAEYNGFLFVIRGSVQAGGGPTVLETGPSTLLGAGPSTLLGAGQVGWLARSQDDGASILRILAGESGARVVLYAGQPQGAAIVSHGPFIGDSREDISRLYSEYRAGRFERMSALSRKVR